MIDSEILDFLSLYNPVVRAVSDQLRELIKEAVPGAQEKLITGGAGVGWRVA